MSLVGQDLAHRAAELTLEKKASEVRILDLRGLSDVTDFFVICSADSDVQARAISNHVQEELKQKYKTRAWHIEGSNNGQWVLMDYVDVVVHIFQPETRTFYALEHLWGDARVTEFEEELVAV